jgi:hypothetical protein
VVTGSRRVLPEPGPVLLLLAEAVLAGLWEVTSTEVRWKVVGTGGGLPTRVTGASG